jgi:hypothetical protein
MSNMKILRHTLPALMAARGADARVRSAGHLMEDLPSPAQQRAVRSHNIAAAKGASLRPAAECGTLQSAWFAERWRRRGGPDTKKIKKLSQDDRAKVLELRGYLQHSMERFRGGEGAEELSIVAALGVSSSMQTLLKTAEAMLQDDVASIVIENLEAIYMETVAEASLETAPVVQVSVAVVSALRKRLLDALQALREEWHRESVEKPSSAWYHMPSIFALEQLRSRLRSSRTKEVIDRPVMDEGGEEFDVLLRLIEMSLGRIKGKGGARGEVHAAEWGALFQHHRMAASIQALFGLEAHDSRRWLCPSMLARAAEDERSSALSSGVCRMLSMSAKKEAEVEQALAKEAEEDGVDAIASRTVHLLDGVVLESQAFALSVSDNAGDATRSSSKVLELWRALKKHFAHPKGKRAFRERLPFVLPSIAFVIKAMFRGCLCIGMARIAAARETVLECDQLFFTLFSRPTSTTELAVAASEMRQLCRVEQPLTPPMRMFFGEPEYPPQSAALGFTNTTSLLMELCVQGDLHLECASTGFSVCTVLRHLRATATTQPASGETLAALECLWVAEDEDTSVLLPGPLKVPMPLGSFWGAPSSTGLWAKSDDHLPAVTNERSLLLPQLTSLFTCSRIFVAKALKDRCMELPLEDAACLLAALRAAPAAEQGTYAGFTLHVARALFATEHWSDSKCLLEAIRGSASDLATAPHVEFDFHLCQLQLKEGDGRAVWREILKQALPSSPLVLLDLLRTRATAKWSLALLREPDIMKLVGDSLTVASSMYWLVRALFEADDSGAHVTHLVMAILGATSKRVPFEILANLIRVLGVSGYFGVLVSGAKLCIDRGMYGQATDIVWAAFHAYSSPPVRDASGSSAHSAGCSLDGPVLEGILQSAVTTENGVLLALSDAGAMRTRLKLLDLTNSAPVEQDVFGHWLREAGAPCPSESHFADATQALKAWALALHPGCTVPEDASWDQLWQLGHSSLLFFLFENLLTKDAVAELVDVLTRLAMGVPGAWDLQSALARTLSDGISRQVPRLEGVLKRQASVIRSRNARIEWSSGPAGAPSLMSGGMASPLILSSLDWSRGGVTKIALKLAETIPHWPVGHMLLASATASVPEHSMTNKAVEHVKDAMSKLSTSCQRSILLAARAPKRPRENDTASQVWIDPPDLTVEMVNAAASYNRGCVLQTAGETAEAEREFRACLDTVGSGWGTVRERCAMNLSLLLDQQGRMREADEVRQRACTGAPTGSVVFPAD